MTTKLEAFYLKMEEPTQGCMLALRQVILGFDPEVTPDFKYGMPFFNYKNKRCCYIWMDKNNGHPYIGIVNGNLVDHPMLEQGNRKKMKILRIDPEQDIPVKLVEEILRLIMI